MHHLTRSAAAGLIATSLLLAGCGSDSDNGSATTTTTAAESASTTEASTAMEITDVWARQSPMGTTAGAIYLNVTSPTDDALMGASVPAEIAGTVEIHETAMSTPDMGEGTESMTMAPVESIELPAGETVALEPGGYHVMLLDLVQPLVTGESFEVTLSFETGEDVTVTAEVREG